MICGIVAGFMMIAQIDYYDIRIQREWKVFGYWLRRFIFHGRKCVEFI